MSNKTSEKISSKTGKDKKVLKKTSIGGQALIEGIMMNGPHRTVLAVRTPNDGIVVEDVKKPGLRQKCPIFRVPIIRGIVGYIESMMMGYKTLMRSAELSGMTDLEEDENTAKSGDKPKSEEKKEKSKWLDVLMNAVMVIASLLGTAIAFVLFMYVPTKLFNLINGAAGDTLGNFRALIEGLMKLAIFIVYILAVSMTKDIKRVFKYHGAEHKTIFCYEHGLELTVENVRRQSRFHPRCGTSFLFLMIAVGILFSTVIVIFAKPLTEITWLWVTIKILLVPLFCGVGYELIKICGRYENIFTKIIAAPGLWIQRITTKEPDDDMIEVAIESIKAVIPENEEDDKW